MKTFLAALLLLAPLAAHADCSVNDFAIQNVKVSTVGTGAFTHLSVRGELVNHCANPAAAQLRIEAKDGSGNVLASRDGWPSGTTNISPGQSIDFDMGRMLHFQTDMQSYVVSVASVRVW